MPRPSSQPQPDLAHGVAYRWPAIGESSAVPLPVQPERHLSPEAMPPMAHSPQYLLYLAEIGENTALLVHDMRSPLSVILNGLRLCHRMPLPQIAHRRLTLALEEAERLNRMINDVIAFARNAHPSEFHWQTLNAPASQARCGVSSPPTTHGQEHQ